MPKPKSNFPDTQKRNPPRIPARTHKKFPPSGGNKKDAKKKAAASTGWNCRLHGEEGPEKVSCTSYAPDHDKQQGLDMK